MKNLLEHQFWPKWPAVIKPNTKINQLVSNVDLAPTFLDLAGVAIPADFQGVSLLPLLNGHPDHARKLLYYHYYENGEHAVSPHFGISDGRYKLIRYYKRVDGWEFFDLQKDNKELNNAYTNPKYKEQIAKMQKELMNEAVRLEDHEAVAILSGS